MARSKSKGTPESELLEAIRRIGNKPDARRSAKNAQDFEDYLVNELDFSSVSFDTEKGSNFWHTVRLAIKQDTEVIKERPTEQQLKEANATVYANETTKQVSYRNARGQWTKASDIISGNVIGF